MLELMPSYIVIYTPAVNQTDAYILSCMEGDARRANECILNVSKGSRTTLERETARLKNGESVAHTTGKSLKEAFADEIKKKAAWAAEAEEVEQAPDLEVVQECVFKANAPQLLRMALPCDERSAVARLGFHLVLLVCNKRARGLLKALPIVDATSSTYVVPLTSRFQWTTRLANTQFFSGNFARKFSSQLKTGSKWCCASYCLEVRKSAESSSDTPLDVPPRSLAVLEVERQL
eukprot:1106836-Amphidinium_carterae.2